MSEWVIILALCGRGECHAFVLGEWQSEAACQSALEAVVQIMEERNFARITPRRNVSGHCWRREQALADSNVAHLFKRGTN